MILETTTTAAKADLYRNELLLSIAAAVMVAVGVVDVVNISVITFLYCITYQSRFVSIFATLHPKKQLASVTTGYFVVNE
jgi:hypothetical protein